jgi:hypothetical protein
MNCKAQFRSKFLIYFLQPFGTKYLSLLLSSCGNNSALFFVIIFVSLPMCTVYSALMWLSSATLLQDNLYNVVTRKAFQRCSRQAVQHLLQDKLCDIEARQAFKHPFSQHCRKTSFATLLQDKLNNVVARQV